MGSEQQYISSFMQAFQCRTSSTHFSNPPTQGYDDRASQNHIKYLQWVSAVELFTRGSGSLTPKKGGARLTVFLRQEGQSGCTEDGVVSTAGKVRRMKLQALDQAS